MNLPKPYKIKASSFYNFSLCPRRVYMDLTGNPAERAADSVFLQMLWERGLQKEHRILERKKEGRSLVEIKGAAGREAFERTCAAMGRGEELIYQGVLMSQDKIGRPDFLERVGGRSRWGDFHYIPCDIKSGRATIAKDGSRLKNHYVDPILFYCELLEAVQGRMPSRGMILDSEGGEILFEVGDYRKEYLRKKAELWSVIYDKKEPEPVISGICKDCVWSDSCLKWARQRQDLTLIFKLGVHKYRLQQRGIRTIQDLCSLDATAFRDVSWRKESVGEKMLLQWQRRARVWDEGKPVVYQRPDFKKAAKEIFYDIEEDPIFGHVYLHGLIETAGGMASTYRPVLILRHEDEAEATRKLWEYFENLSEGDVIYHYGAFEKTKLKRLKEKYGLPGKTLDKFDRLCVDLYKVVERTSDWPMPFYGIKNIARYLGFRWSSEDASGPNSIAWYHEYLKDPDHKKDLLNKILTYNQEDCRAMMVIKDYLEKACPEQGIH